MFFYGIKSTSIKTGILSNIHCDYCDEESEMEYDFKQKYFHLYWIPLIPLKKKTEVCCTKCWHAFETKEFTNEIHKKLNRAKDKYPIRTPLWSFTGIFIITLFFCWAFWQSGRHDVEEADYVKNPKKGDVYLVDSASMKYSTFRIDKVDPENVYYTLNDTTVSKYTKVFFINADRYYTDRKGVLSRRKIEQLYKKDSIMSIIRK